MAPIGPPVRGTATGHDVRCSRPTATGRRDDDIDATSMADRARRVRF